jgi:hypothetical protein
MRPLFYSYYCEYCDGPAPDVAYDRGYVLWRNRPPPSEEYVFKTVEDAERYRDATNAGDLPIREVLTESTFTWHQSRGSIKDVELATRRYEIFPDHRHAPAPHRAFLAPDEAEAANG